MNIIPSGKITERLAGGVGLQFFTTVTVAPFGLNMERNERGVFDQLTLLGLAQLSPFAWRGPLGRVELARTSGATVICCTPSYALHLAEVAAEHKIDVGSLGVRRLILAVETIQRHQQPACEKLRPQPVRRVLREPRVARTHRPLREALAERSGVLPARFSATEILRHIDFSRSLARHRLRRDFGSVAARAPPRADVGARAMVDTEA